MPSINDNFADAVEVTIATNGGTYTSSAYANTGNTTESGEPTVSASADLSMWFKYTPASSGSATFDTQLTTAITSTDSYMAIWTGPALNTLTLVASNDDAGGSGTSLVSGQAVTGGTTYWIQLGGFGLAQMNMVLRVTGPATSGGAGPVTGSTTAEVPRSRSTLSGTVTPPTYPGTLSAAIPPTRSTITGTASTPSGTATLTASLPRIVGTNSGTVTAPTWTGTIAGQLKPVTGSLLGTVANPLSTGGVGGTLPTLTGGIAGSTTSPAGTGGLTAILPRAVSSLAGVVLVDDSLVPPSARILATTVRAPDTSGTVRGTTAHGATRTPTAQGRLR